MGADSAIQWTDATWNPVTGCSKVSQGCAHCYAERLAPRVFAGQEVSEFQPWPHDPSGEARELVTRPRRFTDVRCHPERLDQPLRWQKPRRVFVNSMSDLFHEDVPDEFIGAVFAVMLQARQHTFQILTKRPERMKRLLLHWIRGVERSHDPGHGIDLLPPVAVEFPLPNVWLGVSVEDQAAADERIPILLDTPAALRFLSCEPLLGPVELSRWLPEWGVRRYDGTVDWVIVGGESGPHARPMDLAWARSIVYQARAHYHPNVSTPVFVKQLGRHPFETSPYEGVAGRRFNLQHSHGGDPDEWPEDLQVREFPTAVPA